MPPTPHRPNQRLRSLLAEAEWTQAALAQAVNSLANQQGLGTRYDRTTVAHWLAGSRPRPPVPELIKEALARRLGRQVTWAETGMADALDHARAWTDRSFRDMAEELAELAGAENDPAQRTLVRALPFSYVMDRQLHWTLSDQDPPGVPQSSVRQFLLDATTRTYALHLDAFGGGPVSRSLAAYLVTCAADWLREGTTERRQLLGGAAQLTHLLAQAVADMGAEGQAQLYHRTALRLAADGGDRAMCAVSLRALSAQALRVGRPASAGRLAQAAADAVPHGAPSALQAYTQAQLAVCAARGRHRRAALAALAAAEDGVGGVSGVSGGRAGSGPFGTYPPADFAYQKALTLRALGDDRAALRELRFSLHERGCDRMRSRLLVRARLAELLLARSELEEACAQWHAFLDEAGQVRSRQVAGQVVRLRQELAPYRSSVVARTLLARAAGLARTEQFCSR